MLLLARNRRRMRAAKPESRGRFQNAAAGVMGLFLLAVPAMSALLAGPGPQEKPAAPETELLRVFLEGIPMDASALAKEIPFLQAMDDKSQAQVWVAWESGPAGIRFTGRQTFQGKNDFIGIPPESGETKEAARARILQAIKLGLLRYVSQTPAASRLEVSLLDKVKPTSVVDPWKFWVFSLSLNAFLSGEKSYRSDMWYANVSANRVTPEWKIRAALSGSSSKSEYSLPELEEPIVSTSESRSASGLFVKSLGEHWSAGAYVQIVSSTYNNIEMSAAVTPALEYDLWPYSESTKRQLRFLYAIGPTFVRYREKTIYDKTRESLLSQALSATLEIKQPWGTVSTTLQGSHYLHDLKKYRLELEGEISVRLFQGLSLTIDGGGSRIHDQLFLPAGNATLEEVLLQRRQMETTYHYYLSVGLNLSFGSIFSNVVNPRFGSGDGTSISINF